MDQGYFFRIKKAKKKLVYLATIPQGRVGYEIIDSQ